MTYEECKQYADESQSDWFGPGYNDNNQPSGSGAMLVVKCITMRLQTAWNVLIHFSVS